MSLCKTDMKHLIEKLEYILGKLSQKIKENIKWKMVSSQWPSSSDHVFKQLADMPLHTDTPQKPTEWMWRFPHSIQI